MCLIVVCLRYWLLRIIFQGFCSRLKNTDGYDHCFSRAQGFFVQVLLICELSLTQVPSWCFASLLSKLEIFESGCCTLKWAEKVETFVGFLHSECPKLTRTLNSEFGLLQLNSIVHQRHWVWFFVVYHKDTHRVRSRKRVPKFYY
jgi:hypothetical protein